MNSWNTNNKSDTAGRVHIQEESEQMKRLIYTLPQSGACLLACFPNVRCIIHLISLCITDGGFFFFFFSRFNDIHVPVRLECVKFASHCLMNHPDLARDLTGELLLFFCFWSGLLSSSTILSFTSCSEQKSVNLSFSLLSHQSI